VSRRLIPTGERSGLRTHRDDRKRFVVRADEKLTAFLDLKRQLSRSVLLPFCKSERNSFSGGRITARDSGQRIAKRIHL
jgi:hypothetical protein